MNHRERIEKCISGGQIDHTPIALWRHFPVDDQYPENLAAVTASFQNKYEFDIIKVSPASSFCIKDWGAEDTWTGNPEGSRQYARPVIQNPEDWYCLPILDPCKAHLQNQLLCLKMLIKEFSPVTPIIQTIFSPLSQAKNLVGKNNLAHHMRKYPEALKAGLETIAKSTVRFLEETKKAGIDGIFYAIQNAQFDLMNLQEFEEFQKIYDRDVLESASSLWLNLGHIHGENIMFEQVASYPFQILNWHDQVTKPSLREAKEFFPGVVCGGLRQWETMVLGTPDQVEQESRKAIESTEGKRMILGTGCVLPITAPHGNIAAAIASARKG